MKILWDKAQSRLAEQKKGKPKLDDLLGDLRKFMHHDDDDLIRRGDAIQGIRNACILAHLPFNSGTPEGQRTLEAIKAVREVPSFVGHWKRVGFEKGWECSRCGSRCLLNYESDFYPSKYCPHCGARMGVTDDDVYTD